MGRFWRYLHDSWSGIFRAFFARKYALGTTGFTVMLRATGRICAIFNEIFAITFRQGLFVLTLGREGLVTLRNDDAFRSRDFAADDSVGKVTP